MTVRKEENTVVYGFQQSWDLSLHLLSVLVFAQVMRLQLLSQTFSFLFGLSLSADMEGLKGREYLLLSGRSG
jgi:hypothetical protein